MTSYWIAVASREHVQNGVKGGFMQVCHGKAGPLKRMQCGDGIIYYSPKEVFQEKTPCQKFTAIGKIADEEIYPFDMGGGFIPYRRNVKFSPCKEVSILPLVESLTFICNKKNWGAPFRFGLVKIPEIDFFLLQKHMKVRNTPFS